VDGSTVGAILEKFGSFNIITANNVFAHTSSMREFFSAIRFLLSSSGVFVFEVQYLPDLLNKCYFDMIYHEHKSYHSITPLLKFFESFGFVIFNIERTETHGGSIRVYVREAPKREIQVERVVEEFIEFENSLEFKNSLKDFSSVVKKRIDDIRELVKTFSDGFLAYGYPAKATTLLSSIGLDNLPLKGVLEDSDLKVGKFIPSTGIRIQSSMALGDYEDIPILILPWNVSGSIINRIPSRFTKVYVPLPTVKNLR